MREPRLSPSSRAWLERLQALPIPSADRAQVRTEFVRAEATVGVLLAIVERLRNAVTAFRRSFAVRRQRLG
jgi:hypothetical protein